jgi:hypothetical protein
MTISYVTDIEGNEDYWHRYLKISKVLDRSADGKITLQENCHFVFGGDVCDRGPGDLQVISDLLTMKRDYPDRVHFILGNRDINKMRLSTELTSTLVNLDANIPWVNNKSSPTGTGSSVERLKWILSNTMGCPFTFEFRRQELKNRHLPHSDADIVASFLQSVASDGILSTYLQYGQLGLIIHDTLFIHGALLHRNMGALPFKNVNDKVHHLQEWINELNLFKHTQVYLLIDLIFMLLVAHVNS